MTNIIDELKARGLIKDFSNEDEVRELLNTKQTIYCGFDPSAASMHVGNFVMISMLMRLQRAGHKVVAVVGGATGMIGDPSGKSKERNLQGKETLQENTKRIKEQLERFIDLSDPEKGIIVNNYDWISKLSVLDNTFTSFVIDSGNATKSKLISALTLTPSLLKSYLP